MIRFLTLAVIIFSFFLSFGQQGTERVYKHYNHSWTTFNFEQGISDRYKISIDGSYRRQSLEKGGLNLWEELHWYGARLWGSVEVSEKVTAEISPIGYLYEIPPTYDPTETNQWQDEIRVSLRVRLKSESGLITHRYGLERRFRRNYKDQHWKEYRFRYMLHFNKKIVNDYRILADNEIFINMGKDIALNIFDANRFYVGIQKDVIPEFSVTIGYQNILDLLSSGDEFNVIHVLNITFTLKGIFNKKFY